MTIATPKPCLSEATKAAEKQANLYSHMYEDYWNNVAAWSNYSAYQAQVRAMWLFRLAFQAAPPRSENLLQQETTGPRTSVPTLTAAGFVSQQPTRPVLSGSMSQEVDWDLLGVVESSEDDTSGSEDGDHEGSASNKLIGVEVNGSMQSSPSCL